MTVYDYLNMVVYEGTPNECMSWILDQAEMLSNGTKIYRTWESDGYTYYDVGNVYHTN